MFIRENLTEPSHNRYCKIVLTNTFLLIVLFFLTTPVIVLNVMDTLKLREFEKAVSFFYRRQIKILQVVF